MRAVSWRGMLAGLAVLLLDARAGAQAPPVILNYELYKLGVPMMALTFEVSEDNHAYRIAGEIRSTGLVGAFSRYLLRSHSDGAVTADGFHPRLYESDSNSRIRRRRARLDFAANGSIEVTLDPPEDARTARPTSRETTGTVDPLAAILEVARAVTRKGRCDAKVPVFDGRRRYDLVLSDEGAEHVTSESGSAFEARRCAVDIVKIAGFADLDSGRERIDHARAWLAPPTQGVPPLPVRVEFTSGWGTTVIELIAATATPSTAGGN